MNSTERKSNTFIVRRPLLAYFVLSYTFFWGFLVLIIAILGMLRLHTDEVPAWAMPIIVILGSWMPNLAAVTVTGVLAGREGIRQLLGKFFATRIAVRWYFIALFPFPLAFAAAGLYQLAGGAAPGNMGLSVGFWAGLILLNLLQGATGEEAGWRGFALPRLQETHGPVKASLILGLLWNFWHLPLWLLSGYCGLDLLIYVLAFSVSIISLSTAGMPQVQVSSMVEPLSERELEVLKLLRSELDGPEIAQQLKVSLNTLRSHTKSIFSKLGVNNRRAAVRRAEELHIF